jgi:hypothetical protein
MAIWCEPAFFVKWIKHLSVIAKNAGWQIALIFTPLLIKQKWKRIIL